MRKNFLIGLWAVVLTVVLIFNAYSIRQLQITIAEQMYLHNAKVEIEINVIRQVIVGWVKDMLGLLQGQKEEIDKIEKKVNEFEKKYQTYDNLVNQNVILSNVLIKNYTQNCIGAGTIVKYKDRIFVLSCAHLIEDNSDLITMQYTKDTEIVLNPVKIDKGKDLSVMEIMIAIKGLVNTSKISYLEISNEYPPIGSTVVLVGNPATIEDTITVGNIANEVGCYYIITNTCYYGNSGGALLYKNKVIGVASRLWVLSDGVTYGAVIKLELIKMFLDEYIQEKDNK